MWLTKLNPLQPLMARVSYSLTVIIYLNSFHLKTFSDYLSSSHRSLWISESSQIWSTRPETTSAFSPNHSQTLLSRVTDVSPHTCHIKSTSYIHVMQFVTLMFCSDTLYYTVSLDRLNTSERKMVSVHVQLVHKYKGCLCGVVIQQYVRIITQNPMKSHDSRSWSGLHYIQTRVPEQAPHKP